MCELLWLTAEARPLKCPLGHLKIVNRWEEGDLGMPKWRGKQNRQLNHAYFPKQFTVGFSLRKRRLAAISFGRVPRACPPRVRLCILCPHVFALCVSTMCPLCQLKSTMCPRLWTLSARGLLWGRAVASWSIKFFLSIQQPTALNGMPASQLPWHSFWLPNLAFARAPYAWKTVWGLCWQNISGSKHQSTHVSFHVLKRFVSTERQRVFVDSGSQRSHFLWVFRWGAHSFEEIGELATGWVSTGNRRSFLLYSWIGLAFLNQTMQQSHCQRSLRGFHEFQLQKSGNRLGWNETHKKKV